MRVAVVSGFSDISFVMGGGRLLVGVVDELDVWLLDGCVVVRVARIKAKDSVGVRFANF